MAFNVETGSGSALSNSYASVAEADSYWADRGTPTDWASATDTVKEQALVVATQHLDGQYRSRWKGLRVHSTQALEWPRMGVEGLRTTWIASSDYGNYYIASDTVPDQIKKAVAELAQRVVAGDTLSPDQSEAPIKAKSVKVGPITTSTEYVGGSVAAKVYRVVEDLIAMLLESPTIERERS